MPFLTPELISLKTQEVFSVPLLCAFLRNHAVGWELECFDMS